MSDSVTTRLRWTIVAAVVTVLLVEITAAHARMEITGSTLVGIQEIDFDSTTGALDEDVNFNDPRVNLYFKADVAENISLNFVLWASNDWTHEVIRGNNGAIALDDAAELRATFFTIKNIAGSALTMKAGRFSVPYGYEAPNRTGNGDFSKNDFITNSLLDITAGLDDGISLAGSFEGAGLKTPVAWEIAVVNGGAVTDGNPSGTSGDHRSNDDLSWAGRISAGVYDNLTLQASWYSSDQSSDGDNDPTHVGSTLFVNAVQDVVAANKNLVGLVYNDVDNGGGYDRTFWELAGKYEFESGHLMGFWGNIDADTVTAANAREWNYWGVQGRYNFDKNSYVAARWNRLQPDYPGDAALGEPSLFTIAAGYKLADNTMLKAEWSSFDEDGDGFSNEGTAIGATSANDGNNADADALTLAIGVKF